MTTGNFSDVLVVGGGMAGPTAAACVSRAGLKAVLCEKEKKTGGLVNSFECKGFVFDGGIRATGNTGIDTQKVSGCKVLEPVLQLRKTSIRVVGKALGLPEEIYNRPPFPGPALAARVIGEVTPERVAVVRKATAVVEAELKGCGAFQYLAILHNDKVTGMRNGKRDFGLQIELRCFESTDAVTATVTRLPYEKLEKLAKRITDEVPGVVSVTYNVTAKPPTTIEAV